MIVLFTKVILVEVKKNYRILDICFECSQQHLQVRYVRRKRGGGDDPKFSQLNHWKNEGADY